MSLFPWKPEDSLQLTDEPRDTSTPGALAPRAPTFLIQGAGPPLEVWTSSGAQSPEVDLSLAYATLTQEDTRTLPKGLAGEGMASGRAHLPGNQAQVTAGWLRQKGAWDHPQAFPVSLGARTWVTLSIPGCCGRLGVQPLCSLPQGPPEPLRGCPTSCPPPPLVLHAPTALRQGHQHPPCR